MSAWRLATAALLFGIFGAPMLLPFVSLMGQPEAWQALAEPERLLDLTSQTLLLVMGTLALCLPAGVIAAVLLYRSDIPLSRGFRFLVILTLFVPLPLFASAWQAVLGWAGFGQPWAHGMLAAMWIHAMAGFPWVVWLVGQGLSWVEPPLEEAARLESGPVQVLWHVTLPRARPAIAAAALWVALQTATEITVTDMLLVRTFAEEVYTQLVAGGGAEQARALAVSLPVVLLTGVLALLVLRRWEASLPSAELPSRLLGLFHLGRSRWPCAIIALVLIALLTLVPLDGLVYRAGRGGSPEAWSATLMLQHVSRASADDFGLIRDSLALAVITGVLASGLALLVCWLAVESRWLHALTMMWLTLTWALPAPVLGLGLKEAIEVLMQLEDGLGGPGPARRLLYDGPSLLPLIWAMLLRFTPAAVVLIWPALRHLPRELRETARLDGAAPAAELRWIVAPLVFPSLALAGTAVAVLSLGELGASKLVATPGRQTFAHRIFTEMHYGVTNSLAALCLVVLAVVVVLATIVSWYGKTGSRSAQ